MTSGNLFLVRHGETEWSASGRHTSRTDIDLTPLGEEQARNLSVRLDHPFATVRCSPRLRARRTAELAGLTVTEFDDDLAEWDYGDFEGLTSAEIHQLRPDWSLWTDGGPGGESPSDVERRIDRLLGTLRGEGDTLYIAHGHILRVVAARWLGLDVTASALLALDPARICELGFEHDRHVIRLWNG